MRERGHPGDQRVGRVLGGSWKVDSVLGEGATSTVYAATRLDRPSRPGGSAGAGRAALKVLHAHLAREPEIVEHFFAEARLVSLVEHPGVAHVLDDGVADDGAPYLVFELLVGQTLDELRHRRGGRVPLEEVMPIADALMDTLSAVHEKGIVHRDLKPQNVILLDGGGIKIVDFGVAKQRGHTVDAVPNVVGTPSFMPPEQALGMPSKMDAQSDVWALGATLFLLLSGQPVHVAKHSSAMLLATASTRPRSLADAAPELPRRIVDVIDRALAYRKADRWPDVRSMRSAWQAAHPEWLPTLPPPSFAGDPSFVESNLLVSVEVDASSPFVSDAPGRKQIDTPMAMALFDPRDLVREAEEALERQRTVSTPPRSAPDTPKAGRAGGWGRAIGLAAMALVTVGVVSGAALLAADDAPRAPRAALVAATPPPPATPLPPLPSETIELDADAAAPAIAPAVTTPPKPARRGRPRR